MPHEAEPEDLVVILSLAAIPVEEKAHKNAWQRVVELSANIDNQSQLEAAIGY